MMKKYYRFVLFTIIYNVFVILWGAFVRATGSGAGCGRHWPLCNGEVIPMATSVHTQIEFTHRITSGLSLPLVLFAAYWGFQLFPKPSPGRRFSLIAAISIVLEALIGAGLVLFELVSHNQSLKRTLSMALHFSNTLVLIASLVLMACYALRGAHHHYFWHENPLKKPVLTFTSLFAALGMAGAITALGDTLFPSASLAHGLQADWDVTSHFLIRLRIIHPILAMTFALFFAPWVYSFTQEHPSSEISRKGKIALFLLASNLLLGGLNLYWLAPISLQLIHLFFGVGVWIAILLFFEALLSLKSTSQGLETHQELT